MEDLQQQFALFSVLVFVFRCAAIAFFIFLFRLLLKLNKYLNRQLKNDCSSCVYKQKCLED